MPSSKRINISQKTKENKYYLISLTEIYDRVYFFEDKRREKHFLIPILTCVFLNIIFLFPVFKSYLHPFVSVLRSVKQSTKDASIENVKKEVKVFTINK